MCGLAGIIGEEASREVDVASLEAAAKTMHHRGPDGSRTWREPGIGLAHTRLAIIDRAHGDQPMFSANDRYVVVFNGEIYNHHAIRSELERRGYRLRTHCDTEVLLYLYDWLGPAMVSRLRGMFAFVVLDRERRTALLARDRFGKKPLYYSVEGGALRFASTLDALRALLPESPEVDVGAIAQYLVLQYVPSPLTPYRDVRKLPPGHIAVWSQGALEVRPHWEPPLRSPGDPSDPREVAGRLRELIREAVSIRLESEVPLGVFLSGGLDSSIVAAEMAMSGRTPSTYSMGFRHASFDETRYARIVAERFGTDHHELVADADVPALFRKLVTFYDEPFADSSALATLAVAEAASQHVTVILTGDGGDEMFGGYERYAHYRRAKRIRSALGPLTSSAVLAARAVGRAVGRSRLVTGAGFVRSPWEAYRDTLFHFQPSELPEVLHPEALDGIEPQAPADRLDDLWDQSPGPATTLLWIDEQTYLPDDLLVKMDRATMAHSLEARSPLLDHVLAEFCENLRGEMLFDGPAGKAILRQAYAHVLPPEILTRGKQGFRVPIAAWMRGELRPQIEELLLSGDGPLWDWIRRETVTPLVKRFLEGVDMERLKVWNLLALAGWASERIAGPTGGRPERGP